MSEQGQLGVIEPSLPDENRVSFGLPPPVRMINARLAWDLSTEGQYTGALLIDGFSFFVEPDGRQLCNHGLLGVSTVEQSIPVFPTAHDALRAIWPLARRVTGEALVVHRLMRRDSLLLCAHPVLVVALTPEEGTIGPVLAQEPCVDFDVYELMQRWIDGGRSAPPEGSKQWHAPR